MRHRIRCVSFIAAVERNPLEDGMRKSGTPARTSTSSPFAWRFWAALVSLSCVSASQAIDHAPCLHVVSADGKKASVAQCQGDTDGVANDANVQRVLDTLSIESSTVRFVGCEDGDFSTSEDDREPGKFIVTYPSMLQVPILAAITHELGHVYQIRHAGNLSTLLTKSNIRRIELGADFIAGYVYSMKFKDRSAKDFQQSLLLVGRYVDAAEDAHGSPPMRTAAFRYGLFKKVNGSPDIRGAYEAFQLDDYESAVSFDVSAAVDITAEPTRLSRLDLNKLDDCAAMRRLQLMLGEEHECIATPHDSVAREIHKRVTRYSGKKTCFIEPPDFLGDFSCVALGEEDELKIITCLREVNAHEINAYKINRHSAEAPRVAAYLKRAASCGTSSGDVGEEVSFRLPFPLLFVAKLEFGFDSMRPASAGSAIHGYARLDPTMGNVAQPTIEFVSIYDGVPVELKARETRTTIGPWTLVSDGGLIELMNSQAKNAGVPLEYFGMQYDVLKYRTAGKSTKAKATLIERVADSIASGMEEGGFKRIPEDKIRKYGGLSTRELMDRANEIQPYALRREPSDAFESPVIIMDGQGALSCASSQNSGVVFFLMMSAAEEGKASDYGGLALTITTVGDCALHPGSKARTYFADLLADADSAIRNALRVEP